MTSESLTSKLSALKSIQLSQEITIEKFALVFPKFPNDYVHHARPVVDTGLKIDLLQEYVLIPLDIFRKKLYNKGIETPLDAWLAFLSVDDPVWIERLIQQFPEFIPLYEDIYVICKNVERVMGIYSEELKILDRNTAQLMIDEMQDKIDGMKALLGQKDEVLIQKDEALKQQDRLLIQKNKELIQRDEEIKRLEALLEKASSNP